MRIVFMGTPDFAVPTLRALHKAGHEIITVYSQTPRPAGRGKKLLAGPVHTCAAAMGLEVRTPDSLKSPTEQEAFADLNADVAVVAAYGLILPKAVLSAPRLGCINVHGSLLPRWRGAAPVQRAILAGDEETGVTIMQMAQGLDTGAMLMKRATPTDSKTAGELTEELAQTGAEMMAEYIANPADFPPQAQDDALACYAHKIEKAEARIDFGQSAEQVERQIRAFNPFPGAFFEVRGERIRVHSAVVLEGHDEPFTVIDNHLTIACGSGAIRPVTVQRAGRPIMGCAEFLRGFALPAGTRLT